jgi:ankyrin repeat protein
MKRVRHWLMLGLAAGLAALGCAEIPRTAMLDFTWAHSPGEIDPVLTDFSRAVQARLLSEPDYAWVERQELDRIMGEVDLGRIGSGSAVAAVRLGHWLRADLMLRGEVIASVGGQGELKLEVIDLKRAETVASRTVALTLSSRGRLHASHDDVEAAAAAARQTLAETRQQLKRWEGKKVIAPMYFKNVGATSRLDFIEPKLTAALTAVAAHEGGFRVLQFPQATEAGEEASLAVAGLTDEPAAVQQVADVYVWGTFKEELKDGMAVDELPVTMAIQVWTGSGAPREVQWQGKSKELTAGVNEVVARILQEAKVAPTAGAKEDSDRLKIAALLSKRVEEGAKRLHLDRAFLSSTAGRQLFTYQVKLLETACFFDPANRELQLERLDVTWNKLSPLEPLTTPRGWWLRVADYVAIQRRFERRPDGTFDETWPLTLSEIYRQFVEDLDKIGWRRKDIKLSPQEVHQQTQVVVREWARLVARSARAVAAESSKPDWWKGAQEMWLEQLVSISHQVNDPVILRDAYETVWPVLAEEIGHRLKLAYAEGGKSEHGIPFFELYSIYAAFADSARASALLDQAWNACRDPMPVAPATAPVTTPGPVTTPTTPRHDLPWGIPKSSPVAATMPRADTPVLAATIREVVLPAVKNFKVLRAEAPIQFEGANREVVETMAWHDGRLWVSMRTEEPLPAVLGTANQQGNHYLWSYDPALHASELLTPKLGGHSTITTLLSDGEKLWLGLSADGVWQYRMADGTVHRLKPEDGVQTPLTQAGTRRGDDLFFLGGDYPELFISKYSIRSKTWSVIRSPVPEQALRNLAWAKAQHGTLVVHPPQLAVSGHWLCCDEDGVAFFNLESGKWEDLLGSGSSPPPVPGVPYVPMAKPSLGLISADETGFWTARTRVSDNKVLLGRLDPQHLFPRTKQIPMKGQTRAMAHHGPWLWLLQEVPNAPSQLVLLDKRTMTLVGHIDLPGKFPRVLVATDDRVWVGGATFNEQQTDVDDWPALLEVRLQEPRAAGGAEPPSRPTDFAVIRAVAAGDRNGLEAALAAKGDPNERAPGGWTALMSAVDAGQSEIVTRLLAAGANPNPITDRGETALSLAVSRGDAALVDQLLKQQADPNRHLPTKLLGFLKFRQRAEPTDAGPAKPAVQPVNLQASVTEDGLVKLTWEDRAKDEDHYDIIYENPHGMRSLAGIAPANSTSWIASPGYFDPVLNFQVMANNGIELPDGAWPDDRPKVLINRPTLGPNLVWQQYGIHPNDVLILPVKVTAETALGTAILGGHDELVQGLLAHKADPNLADPAGNTPLILALRGRHYAIARQLLAAGAQAETEIDTGETPASLAYRWHEDRELLQALLAAMTPRQRRVEASTLIAEAAAKGQIADIEWLVGFGGDLGERSGTGSAIALVEALKADQIETAHWIWAHATKLQARWQRGELVKSDEAIVEAAIVKRDTELYAQMLAAGFPLEHRLNVELQAVVAAEHKAFGILDLLWARRVDFHQMSANQKSALDCLAKAEAQPYLGQPIAEPALPEGSSKGRWKLPAELTLHSTGPKNSNYDLDPTKAQVNADFIAACNRGNLEGAARAVAGGAQLECEDAMGATALQLAVKAGSLAMVRWLVEEGVSVDHLSKKGNSPLTFAVNAQNMEISEYLLSSGADINRFTAPGGPPLAVAVNKGDTKFIISLLDAGADPNLAYQNQSNGRMTTPLTDAVWGGRESVADLLLSRGANPQAQDFSRVTDKDEVREEVDPSILMYAAAGKNLPLMKKLVSLGQNPRFKTWEGDDALSWAAGAGSKEVVEYLLPLSELHGKALSQAHKGGYEEIAELLRQAGYRDEG